MKKLNFITLVAACLVLVSGCNQSNQNTSSTGGGEAGHRKAASLPHGGTPVQIGEHDYHLELVNDPAEGKMTAYVLDDHAENSKTVPPTTFEIVVAIGGEEKRLNFQPLTNASSANGSAFVASADWLKTATNFEAVIPKITLAGESFDNIKFSYPKGSQHSH